MATYKIEVTQEDIDKGCPGDNLCCPVARAANRVIEPEGGIGVAVGPTHIRVFKTGAVLKMPKHIQDWVARYDQSVITGDLPEPVSFEVKE